MVQLKHLQRHRHYILTLVFLLGSFSYVQAQTGEKPSDVIRPLLLSKDVLSGIGLEKIDLKDAPERDFYQKRLYGGREISVYVVSSESWTVPFDGFWFDEYIHILQGSARVGTEEGDLFFSAGSPLYSPKGFKGEWEVRAGDHLHYELSVITNRRADSSAISIQSAPAVLDPDILSGADIAFDSNGLYEHTFLDGVELTIQFKAEEPRALDLSAPQKERLICILSGQLILEDADGMSHTFNSGDHVVIPHHYTGHWESRGHSMMRYINVKKS